jgi:hypothetical protein
MNFELYKSQSALRWKNACDFIAHGDPMRVPGSDQVLIAFLTFNASAAALEVLDKIYKDYPESHVMVVDNCSHAEHWEKLKSGVANYPSANLVQTKLNLGGAGGYALINELFLRSDYWYLLLTEDDAMPVEGDLVTKLIESRNESDLVGCYYYNNNSTSFSFHFTLYSRRLIEVAGIPDPRYFQGGDDAEIRDRHFSALKQYGTKPLFVDRGYHHPTLKGMGTPAKVIRAQRNSLLTHVLTGTYLHFFLRAALLLAYGSGHLLRGNIAVFKTTLSSCLALPAMNTAGCKLFSVLGIHDSLDSYLTFTGAATEGLVCEAGTPHLQTLLGLKPAGLKSKSVLLTTLESPWVLIYTIWASKIYVAKNLSEDGRRLDLGEYHIKLRDRVFSVMAFALAFMMLPLYGLLFIRNAAGYKTR